MSKKSKGRLIVDMDSTEDPAHGKQEGVAYNGHFGKSCYYTPFCSASEADCLAVKLRNGNVHSAEGALEMLVPIVERHRDRLKGFGSGRTLLSPSRRSTSTARASESPISYASNRTIP